MFHPIDLQTEPFESPGPVFAPQVVVVTAAEKHGLVLIPVLSLEIGVADGPISARAVWKVDMVIGDEVLGAGVRGHHLEGFGNPIRGLHARASLASLREG